MKSFERLRMENENGRNGRRRKIGNAKGYVFFEITNPSKQDRTR